MEPTDSSKPLQVLRHHHKCSVISIVAGGMLDGQRNCKGSRRIGKRDGKEETENGQALGCQEGERV
jgi:hypothetical protein